MITYNNPKDAKERNSVKPLTEEEIKQAIDLLNRIIDFSDVSKTEENLLQRLIWNYEQMKYYQVINEGVYCTHHPEKVSDPEKTMYQLSFKRGS